jgi:hypothetical protein
MSLEGVTVGDSGYQIFTPTRVARF